MKKFLIAMAAAVALTALAGCGASEGAEEEATPAQNEEQQAAEESGTDQNQSESEAEPEMEAPSGGIVEAIGMTLRYEVVGEHLELELTGPTTGWIAVGFKPSRGMKDANILIGYVDGSEVVVSDDFGTTMTAHRPDDRLGGESHVEVISGSEDDNSTTLRFRIPLDSGDEYDQPLTVGETHRLIFAYGENGADDTNSYHAARGSGEITL